MIKTFDHLDLCLQWIYRCIIIDVTNYTIHLYRAFLVMLRIDVTCWEGWAGVELPALLALLLSPIVLSGLMMKNHSTPIGDLDKPFEDA